MTRWPGWSTPYSHRSTAPSPTINAYSTFDMPRMYAMLIVLFVLAIGANALVGRLGGLEDIKRT